MASSVNEARLAKLDEALLEGIADSDADRVTDAQIVFDRLIRKYEAGRPNPRRESSAHHGGF